MTLDELLNKVAGPVFVPGQGGYDEEKTGFQLAARRAPAVVVGATGPADVRAALGYAGAHGLPVAVQATGHGQAASAADAVLITTSRMSEVRVDPVAGTARIEAGVRWGAVVSAAAEHGLAPLSGSSPDVGAVSYVLGGGHGVLARRFGYAADHVRRIEVVTADGRSRTVDEAHEPDLFWALRGAGQNFGVVTAMEVDLVLLRTVFGGGLYFDLDQLPEVLQVWQDWTETVPEELTSSIGMVPYPDLPAVPEPLRGRHVAHIRIAYTGDPDSGDRLIAPLRQNGPRLIDHVAEMPYTAAETIFNDPRDPHAYHGTGAFLPELGPASLSTVLDLSRSSVEGMPCIVQLNHLGGALSRPAESANAVGHRDAAYLLRVLSPLGPSTSDPFCQVHEQFLDKLPVSGRSLNFMFGEHTVDQVRAAYEPADYTRLRALKAAYDPENMFRLNHNIPPRG